MLRRFASEPLVHFLLIGVGLFVAFGLMNEQQAEVGDDVIVISAADVDRLSQSFEGVWRRPPDAEETSALIDDHVLEEVMVREATQLGLDQNDTVIRRRLRQKMDFLIGAAGSALQPTDEELSAYFAENAAEFTPARRVAFLQVFLGEQAGDAQVAEALDALRNGADPALIGPGSLLPPGMAATPEQGVDAQFGRGMFAQLSELETGDWAGPVQSGYGLHLVNILDLTDPATPELDAVRPRVIEGWRAQKTKELSERQYDALRDRYSIILPDKDA